MSDGSDARAERSRGPMIAVIVIAAVLVVAGVVAALLLTGVWSPWAPRPTPTTSASATASSTPTATSTPSPETTAPVRVPLTCDDVLTQSAAEAIVGVPLEESDAGYADPLSASDDRVGALTCSWRSTAPLSDGQRVTSATAVVVPGVSADAYRSTADGETYSGTPAVEGLGEPSRAYCAPGSGVPFCGMVDLVGDYAVGLTVIPSAPALDDATAEATRQQFLALVDAVSAAAPPGPLWEPAGENLAGVSECGGLLAPDQVIALTGDPEADVFRIYDGEFAIASFQSNQQVGGYGCAWTSDVVGNVRAMVLPGGAGYFPDSRPVADGVTWSPTSGYPGQSFVSSTGDEVAMLVDGAWFDVRVTPGQEALLPGIAETVVSNVQAAGPASR